MNKRFPSLIVIASLLALPAFAAPAPWYKWRSKVSGLVFCQQAAPGEGWERVAGPYRDARCELPTQPKPGQ